MKTQNRQAEKNLEMQNTKQPPAVTATQVRGFTGYSTLQQGGGPCQVSIYVRRVRVGVHDLVFGE